MKINSYAKINLSLDVTGTIKSGYYKGYHSVEMLMLGIGLYDELEVNISKEGDSGESRIALLCDSPGIPTDSRNTAWKAAELMLKKCGTPSGFSAEIKIKKNIPAAAGLAGGSSNAAAVIVALNELLGLNLTDGELCAEGAKIGADVPFSIMTILGTPCALASGIGDELTPVARSAAPDYWILLVKPPVDVITADVYKKYDRTDIGKIKRPRTSSAISAVETGDMDKLRESASNVLESVTLAEHPEVMRIKEALQRLYPENHTLMSGSGPTVYSVFTDRASAERALQRANADFKGCRCFIAESL